MTRKPWSREGCSAHIEGMTTTTPTYHALKELHAATRQGSGILPSPWTEADTEATYEAMASFYPAGTGVTAVYASKRNLTEFKTFTGKVTGVSRIDNREPSFHLKDERGFNILLPGSVLAKA